MTIKARIVSLVTRENNLMLSIRMRVFKLKKLLAATYTIKVINNKTDIFFAAIYCAVTYLR